MMHLRSSENANWHVASLDIPLKGQAPRDSMLIVIDLMMMKVRLLTVRA